jgi:cation diffusion facilitator family transporter
VISQKALLSMGKQGIFDHKGERQMSETRYNEGKRVLWIAILINFILGVAKVLVGTFSHSRAVLADGIHTFSDIASSVGLLVGFFIAKKPADEKHRYGHERAESIAAFVLALLVVVVGINIGYGSIQRLWIGQLETPGVLAVWVTVLSIVVKEWQYRFTMKSGKRLRSSALQADAWHHRSDALSSLGALIGVLGSRFGLLWMDSAAGVVVAIVVVKTGIGILFHGIDELMDASLPEEELEILRSVIHTSRVEAELTQIRSRRISAGCYLDLTIQVDGEISVDKGHAIADQVEDLAKETYEDVLGITVHVEPEHRREI